MDQQISQVLVSSLGDPEQFRLAAGGRLARHQPEPGGEVSGPLKAFCRADGGDQGGRRQGTDPRHLAQASCRLVLARGVGQFVIQRFNALVEPTPLGPHLLDQEANTRPQRGCLLRQDVRQGLGQLGLAPRDPDPALQKDRTQLIDHRRAPGDQAGSHPVQGLQIQLHLALDGNKTHGRAAPRLGHTFRITIVVLLRLDIRPHVLRGHQARLMPQGNRLSGRVMRPATGLHHNPAGRQVGQIS